MKERNIFERDNFFSSLGVDKRHQGLFRGFRSTLNEEKAVLLSCPHLELREMQVWIAEA